MKPSTPTPSSSTFTCTQPPSKPFTSSVTTPTLPFTKKPLSLSNNLPFKTAYGPHLNVSLICTGQGRTKQSFKAECDINSIMARYDKTGVIEFTQKHAPQYGDCTGLEFQASMELIARARAMFEDLPAKIRDRFNNEPRQLLDFVHDEKNREEAIHLGLVQPMVAQAPDPQQSAQPAAGAPGEPPKGAKQGSERDPTPPP